MSRPTPKENIQQHLIKSKGYPWKDETLRFPTLRGCASVEDAEGCRTQWLAVLLLRPSRSAIAATNAALPMMPKMTEPCEYAGCVLGSASIRCTEISAQSIEQKPNAPSKVGKLLIASHPSLG